MVHVCDLELQEVLLQNLDSCDFCTFFRVVPFENLKNPEDERLQS